MNELANLEDGIAIDAYAGLPISHYIASNAKVYAIELDKGATTSLKIFKAK